MYRKVTMPMLRRISCLFLIAVCLAGLVFVPKAAAKLEVELDVQKVAEHSVLVTLTWTATIIADRDWDGCELQISFRDSRDREIHLVTKSLSLKTGRNEITGHEICEVSIWEKTRKFSGKLNCGF